MYPCGFDYEDVQKALRRCLARQRKADTRRRRFAPKMKRLREMWMAGEPTARIRAELGYRSDGNVRSTAYLQGLPPRPWLKRPSRKGVVLAHSWPEERQRQFADDVTDLTVSWSDIATKYGFASVGCAQDRAQRTGVRRPYRDAIPKADRLRMVEGFLARYPLATIGREVGRDRRVVGAVCKRYGLSRKQPCGNQHKRRAPGTITDEIKTKAYMIVCGAEKLPDGYAVGLTRIEMALTSATPLPKQSYLDSAMRGARAAKATRQGARL